MWNQIEAYDHKYIRGGSYAGGETREDLKNGYKGPVYVICIKFGIEGFDECLKLYY